MAQQNAAHAGQTQRELPALAVDLDVVFEHLPIALALFDAGPGFRCLRHNRHYLALFPQRWAERGSAVGATFDEFVDPASLPAVRQIFEATIASGEVFAADDFPVNFAGERAPRHFQWSLTPLRDPSGAVAALLASGVEITGRKHVEARLQAKQRQLERANERLRFLVESSAVLASSLDYETTLARVVRLGIGPFADWCSLYLIDDAGVGRWVTSQATTAERTATIMALNGRFPPERLPTTVVSTVLRTGVPQLLPEVDDARLAQAATNAEHLRLYLATETRSYIVVPLLLGGRVIGALSCARTSAERRYDAEDVTLAEELARRAVVAIEHARLYRAEQEARIASEAAVQARDHFVYVAAHELRTPLTALYGKLQLMQRRALRDGQLDPRDQATLDQCVDQARRYSRLVDKLLDITRIEHGRLTLELAPLSLAALVRRVADEIRPGLGQHRLEVELPEDPLLIEGDALRIEQVLQNLIDNAVKYSPAGGRVALKATAGEQVCVSVSDEGVGVAPEALPHLFERFYRAQFADEPAPGFGIGLFVVKEIMTLHGGTVTVTSTPAVGSSFTICLPRSVSSGSEPIPGD